MKSLINILTETVVSATIHEAVEDSSNPLEIGQPNPKNQAPPNHYIDEEPDTGWREFWLDFNGDDEWQVSFSIEIHAPVFEILNPILIDANDDGIVNVIDVVLTINYIFNIATPSADEFCAVEMNGDGILNILDIVILANLILSGYDSNPAGDLNQDAIQNILDIVILVNLILGQ